MARLAKCLAAAVTVIAMGVAVAIACPRIEVYLMKCRDLSDQELSAARRRLDAMALYAPSRDGRAAVQFQFSLDPDAVGESLFVMESIRTDSAVYRGAYRRNLIVEIDERLAGDRHYDIIEFKLLRIEGKSICTWMNDEGEPYWRSGAIVSIEFLWHRAWDDNGLPKSFNVFIR